MDILKTLGVALIGGLVVLGGGFLLNTGTSVVENGRLGALVGPDIPSDYLKWGDVATYHFSQSMTQNASTTCNWQTPAATSTVRISARFTLASTSASLIEIGKSAGPNAITTKLGAYTLGAGAQGVIVSSSTPADFASDGVDDAYIVGPSQWLAVKLVGGGTGSVPTGTCNFTAETLP